MSALKICPQCGTEYELDQRFCPKDGSTLKAQGSAAGELVGAIIADRYNVIKKLGEGGMGTVYLAEHVKMGRKSAVKVMNPGMVHDADAISRFNREAANASRINHPNVAAVYDFGETSDGLIYLAMEFVEGPALTKVIEEAGALPPIRAADITRQAAEALAVAHDMGIVHRDLKPDNIMLAKNRDGSDCVKVVDFGIAKAANNEAQKVTKTGLVVGTPEYMSPEQLAGDKLDGRSDTYSLGLVAFAMMTGKLPFPADTVQESMIARLTDQPKTLTEMKAEVAWSPEVQAVMDKALQRDAAARYQTASEFG
ncbi:MAG: serine/threonine-protein kinase, partial [Gemmatimonadaceae bacterium]